MNRLQKFYNTILCYDLIYKDHYINVMELPKLNQITFNTGLGLKAILDKKQILIALLNMELISGQYPIVTRAKKSIDKFKLREHMPVGCKVTLRGNLEFIFLDRFINLVLPSIDISNDIFLKKSWLKKESLDSFSGHISEQGIALNSSSTFYRSCLPILRSKIWFRQKISSGGISKFSPQSLHYSAVAGAGFFFSSLQPSTVVPSQFQNHFLSNHTFSTRFSLLSGKTHYSFKRDLPILVKSTPHFYYSTITFGFKDFISSTAFGNIFNCGQLDFSYGFDINFVLRYSKNSRILSPFYFFSGFQMPF